ncbi:MAG: hypothetical protein Q9207_008048 [Kuettlingeria erythrocarpa]
MAPTKPTKKPDKTAAPTQKTQRPSKRNLVRWNDDMDKKLLLAVQWACNRKSVKIPWEMVGKEMGEKITESAVIQHLAKLRQRMVNDGLPVPPALTRGGRTDKSAVQKPAGNRVSKRVSKKKGPARREEEEEDSDSDGEYDSEEEIVAKKTTKKGKKPATKTRVKKEYSSPKLTLSRNATDDESEQEIADQSYAVGDEMWDLVAENTSTTKAKQNASKPSGQSSDKETKSTMTRGTIKSVRPSSSHASQSDAARTRFEVSGQSNRSLRDATMSNTHRTLSESSGQSPQQLPQVVVKLRIGKEGFAKLGLSEQMDHYRIAEGVNDSGGISSSSSEAEDDANNKSMINDQSGTLNVHEGAFGGGVGHHASGFGAGYPVAQYHLPSYDHGMDVSQQHVAPYGSFPSNHMEAAAALTSITFGTPHAQHSLGNGANPAHGYGNHFAGQAVSGTTYDATYGGMDGPNYTDASVFSGHTFLPGIEHRLPMGDVPFDHGVGFFDNAYNGDASHYHADEVPDVNTFTSMGHQYSPTGGQGHRSLGSPFQDRPRVQNFGESQESFESADLH